MQGGPAQGCVKGWEGGRTERICVAFGNICGYNKTMAISFDPAKRAATLERRGLDFAAAVEVFAGRTATATDSRKDYGEVRFITAGYLRGRFVVLVWTPRGEARHVISMRHGHGSEEHTWFD